LEWSWPFPEVWAGVLWSFFGLFFKIFRVLLGLNIVKNNSSNLRNPYKINMSVEVLHKIAVKKS